MLLAKNTWKKQGAKKKAGEGKKGRKLEANKRSLQ